MLSVITITMSPAKPRSTPGHLHIITMKGELASNKRGIINKLAMGVLQINRYDGKLSTRTTISYTQKHFYSLEG